MSELVYTTNGNEIGCSSDPWGGYGNLSCPTPGGTFPGRGWYKGDWGGAAESLTYSWYPVYSQTVWGGAAESMTQILQAIDKPLPDPGYPFNGVVDFGTMLPAWDVGSNYQIGANPITKYLTDHYAQAVADALNSEYRAGILPHLVPGSGKWTFNVGPTWPNPGTPYDPVISDYSGSTFARVLGAKFMISASKLQQILASVAAGDPIAATFLGWYVKAEAAAKQRYDMLDKAETKMFWVKAAVATMLAFGGAATIAAISAAASSSAGLGVNEVMKAAQLAYKAYNGVQTMSTDIPNSVGVGVPQPSGNSIAAMQTYVDQYTLNGLLQSAYSSALDAGTRAKAGDLAGAQQSLSDSEGTYSDAENFASGAGLAIPDNARVAINNAQGRADQLMAPAPAPAPVSTPTVAAVATATIPWTQTGQYNVGGPGFGMADWDALVAAGYDPSAILAWLVQNEAALNAHGITIGDQVQSLIDQAKSGSVAAAINTIASGTTAATAPTGEAAAAPAEETAAAAKPPFPWLFVALSLLGLGT